MRAARRDHLRDGGWRLGSRAGAIVTIAGALGLGFANPSSCLAQSRPEPSLRDYLPPSEPEVSRDEWRRRIEDARRRAKDASRERREHPELYKPIPEDPTSSRPNAFSATTACSGATSSRPRRACSSTGGDPISRVAIRTSCRSTRNRCAEAQYRRRISLNLGSVIFVASSSSDLPCGVASTYAAISSGS